MIRDNDNQIEKFFRHIKEYWVMYLFVGSLIVNYSTTQTAIASLNQRTDKLEVSQERSDLNYSEIRSRLASIDTNIQYLKERK
jgi:chaperonin cofactor prefoldin